MTRKNHRPLCPKCKTQMLLMNSLPRKGRRWWQCPSCQSTYMTVSNHPNLIATEIGDEEWHAMAKRYLELRNQVIKKHGLRLIKDGRGLSYDAVWLAHHLWGSYYKSRIYRGIGSHTTRLFVDEWLGPPVEKWRLKDLTAALEVLARLPTSLIRDDIENFIQTRRMTGSSGPASWR